MNDALLQRACVLIVEDDPVMRRLIESLVSPKVLRMVSAANGQEGLALWRAEQPDVVITDIGMPLMDGLAMSTEIHALDQDSEIIILSSSNEVSDLARAMEIGVERYVFKPVNAKLLIDALRKCYQSRLRSIELRLSRIVFEVANEGILITDEHQSILAVNPAFSQITGYRPDEILGKHTRILSSGLHEPEFYREMWDSLGSHGRWSGEVTNRRSDGGLYTQWLSIAAVASGLGNSHRQYVGLVSDITERKKEEETIRRLAHFDSLTGLANRALFDDRLQRELAGSKRHQHSMAVLFIDLDHFKAINDTFGHAVGDVVLKVVADRMCACVRQTDMVSRRGGDEFVIILEEVNGPDVVSLVCSKLIETISQPITFEEKIFVVTASIGVAMAPEDAEDIDSLLNAADFALYEAKGSGRNAFSFFSQETMKSVNSRLDMEKELRDGMVNWRYTIRYLPEVCLKTGKVGNVEALLRFDHPEFGLLDAGRFLELAEEIGIMPELGNRALAQATQETALLSSADLEIGLVVDLSARQLSAPGAAKGLLAVLDAAGVPKERITFESAERSINHNEAAMKTLYELAASGCKFTLDDFGVGYCSFSLLSQLPMTSIKIDRSFVGQLEHGNQYRQLVAALIAFSQRLGLKSIAEGVETQEQLDFLKEAGCDYAQGYFFGKPMEFEALRKYVTT
jgi:diguanylate cyclase (GGDEF)-like protein/PAS domain S-box-containing protein